MKNKITFGARLRYKFDNTLSKGISALIAWLALITLVMVFLGALLLVIINFEDTSESGPLAFWDAVWGSIVNTLGMGLIEGDTWAFRIVELLVLIGGIFITSTLIGILTTGLEEKLDDLRKGHSFVIEKNHTIILGWSPKIFTIISELVVANRNQKDPKIVVMASMDKVEMEDTIRAQVPDKMNTRIICRTGSPIDLVDLEIVNFNDAKSIIILADDSENPDIYVIKAILALTNNPRRKAEPFHIVAEIKDSDNLEAADLVGNNEATFVVSADLIARVATQTCRQSGLSIIYTELLNFEGNEIYFKADNQLIGKNYKEILHSYGKSAIIGLMKGKNALVNPANETIYEANDKIICLSTDDDTIIYKPKKDENINYSAIVNQQEKEPEIEKNIILGWNEKGSSIAKKLDEYVQVGSQLKIISDADISKEIKILGSQVQNQDISFYHGDITKRETLTKEDIRSFDNVIILGSDSTDIQQADAKTLIALLHIRNMVNEEEKNFNIVSEMFDIKNRELAEIAKADDFIVSDRIISLMIAQLSENKELRQIFSILFDAQGCEIYLKPAKDYVAINTPITFYTVIESAVLKNETAVGYRLIKYAHDSDKTYGIVISPNKNETVTFSEKDKLIVIADN